MVVVVVVVEWGCSTREQNNNNNHTGWVDTGTSSSSSSHVVPQQSDPLTVPLYPHRLPSAACSASSSAGVACAGQMRPPRSVRCPWSLPCRRDSPGNGDTHRIRITAPSHSRSLSLRTHLSLRVHLPRIQAGRAQQMATRLYPDVLVVLRTDLAQLERAPCKERMKWTLNFDWPDFHRDSFALVKLFHFPTLKVLPRGI